MKVAKLRLEVRNASRHFAAARATFLRERVIVYRMKVTLASICVAVAAATVQLAPAAHAQEQGRRAMPGARWQSLSEPERAKLRAAHQQAMQDAQVRAAHERLIQARREFRDVMRPAMLRADPSVQPILERLRSERRNR
jgi:hypothetical protein